MSFLWRLSLLKMLGLVCGSRKRASFFTLSSLSANIRARINKHARVSGRGRLEERGVNIGWLMQEV